MAGERQPGAWGMIPVSIDDGTSCRIESRPPGTTGSAARPQPSSAKKADSWLPAAALDGLDDLKTALGDFVRTDSLAKLQPIIFRLIGPQTFGLGVLYGMGENVVGSVVELAALAKTFLLADLHDRATQSTLLASSPFGVFQNLLAQVSMRAFGERLAEASRERDELIAELRHAMTNLGEVFGNVKAAYVRKWARFEMLVTQQTLSSQFEAGRIFGEVLLDVLSVIGGGVAAARAASRIPRLARLARLRIPPKAGPSVSRPTGASARATPATPSEARAPAPTPDAPEPKKAPPTRPLAAELAGSEFNGVTAQRVRPGSNERVAVVGRNMTEVEKYAQGLTDRGHNVELFAGDRISASAQREWAQLKKAYAPDYIPEDVVPRTQMFRENQAWAKKLADEGYTVVDIGDPLGKGFSPFYDMEKGILFPGK